MTATIWQSIAETPWWFYAGFIYLFWLSILAIRPRQLTVYQLSGLSLLFFFGAIGNIWVTETTITALHLAIWSSGLLLGSGLSFLHCRRKTIIALGNWVPLISLLIYIFAYFYDGFQLTDRIQLICEPRYVLFNLLCYGVFTGWFIGKMI